jgi:hypothetical protein
VEEGITAAACSAEEEGCSAAAKGCNAEGTVEETAGNPARGAVPIGTADRRVSTAADRVRVRGLTPAVMATAVAAPTTADRTVPLVPITQEPTVRLPAITQDPTVVAAPPAEILQISVEAESPSVEFPEPLPVSEPLAVSKRRLWRQTRKYRRLPLPTMRRNTACRLTPVTVNNEFRHTL